MANAQEVEGNSETMFQPDFAFVNPVLKTAVERNVRAILKGSEFRDRICALLTTDPEQTELDVQALLDMNLAPAESIAAVTILKTIIQQRWDIGAHVMHCDPQSIDASMFDTIPTQDYAWMPSKVAQDAFWGGMGRLSIVFGAGKKEAETTHTHPGARIVVSMGKGRLSSDHIPGGEMHFDPGTIFLMPGKVPHNFSAYPDADWNVLPFHLPYAGTGKEAMKI